MKTLGTDPAGDGPPALDITYLKAGRAGKNLELHIGIDSMLPEVGGYPQIPGIQWAFVVKKKTYVAEAYVDGRNANFLLFEDLGDSFRQVATIDGTYDAEDGFIRLLVPLKAIKAKKGTKIKGAPGGADVDAHLHLGPHTHYADTAATKKPFTIP